MNRRNAPRQELDGAGWFSLLEERFGIPAEVFDAFVLVDAGGRHLKLVPRHLEPTTDIDPADRGMPFLNPGLSYPKLTTAATLRFGRHAIRHCVDLGRDAALEYLRHHDQLVSADALIGCETEGYVVVRSAEMVLGLGRIWDLDTHPRLESQFPRAWALR